VRQVLARVAEADGGMSEVRQHRYHPVDLHRY